VPQPRRFPPPWSVEELDACFIVKNSAGQKMAYVYFEDEPGFLDCRWPIIEPSSRRDQSKKPLITRRIPWRLLRYHL
jgi:hypothetical protein